VYSVSLHEELGNLAKVEAALRRDEHVLGTGPDSYKARELVWSESCSTDCEDDECSLAFAALTMH
jgi:hypothetical protein